MAKNSIIARRLPWSLLWSDHSYATNIVGRLARTQTPSRVKNSSDAVQMYGGRFWRDFSGYNGETPIAIYDFYTVVK